MRKLQVTYSIKALLIFGGIILMQIFASAVYALGYIFTKTVSGTPYNDILDGLTGAGYGNTSQIMWISAISATLSMIWCLILYMHSSWRIENLDYREVFTLKNILGIVGAGACGCITLTVFLSVIMNFMPKAFENYNEIMKNLEPSGGMLTFIYVLVIGPTSEELIFRGAIFDRTRLAFGFWIGNALQALLFGIYHMNIVQGIYAFFVGMILGMIVYATGSIICSIIAHIIFNSTTYIIQFAFGGDSIFMVALFMALVLISVIVLILSLRYFIIKCKNKEIKYE